MVIKLDKNVSKQVDKAKKSAKGFGKAIAAGAASAALLAGNLASAAKDKTAALADRATHKTPTKSQEGIYMKKSTFVALLVALAAVVGVLAGLYFYVLRREKELDEYEQLLFSEDFNDELLDEELEGAAE